MRLYGSMTSIIKGLFGHGFEVKISNVPKFFFDINKEGYSIPELFGYLSTR